MRSLAGGAAFDESGEHFPESALETCQAADAVLYGSVGGPAHEQHLPKWHDAEKNAVLGIRKALDLAYAQQKSIPSTRPRVSTATRHCRSWGRPINSARVTRRDLFWGAQD